MKILYFASAETHSGTRAEHLDTGGPLTLGQLWILLVARHSGLSVLRDHCMVARNQEFVRGDDTLLYPGDEVALLPPFSGG